MVKIAAILDQHSLDEQEQLMSHISSQLDEARDLIIHTVTGAVSIEEVLSTMETYYTQQVTKYVLWDLSAADMKLIHSEDLYKIIELAKMYGQLRPAGRGSRDVTFAIGRQLALLGEAYEQAFEISSFRNYDEAMEWLVPSS